LCRFAAGNFAGLAPAQALQPRQQHALRRSNERAGPLQLDRAPQIPGGGAAIGPPALAPQGQLLRVGHLLQPVGGAKAGAQPEVVHGQHIRAPEVEYQEHLHRPAADAADLGETLDDRFVLERDQRLEIGHHSLQRLRGEVLERGDLRK